MELATGTDNLDLAMEEVEIAEGSPLADRTLVDANLRQRFGVIVVGIQRSDRRMDFNPPPDSPMRSGDKLVVLGRADSLKQLEAEASTQMSPHEYSTARPSPIRFAVSCGRRWKRSPRGPDGRPASASSWSATTRRPTSTSTQQDEVGHRDRAARRRPAAAGDGIARRAAGGGRSTQPQRGARRHPRPVAAARRRWAPTRSGGCSMPCAPTRTSTAFIRPTSGGSCRTGRRSSPARRRA